MKRISISLLAVAISAIACSAVAVAQNHSDGYYAAGEPAYQNPTSYQREQCWNERTNAYDDGYYRDSSGRLYRGDGHSNTGGILLGALIGGALGNQVGRGDGRTAATVAGAVIGGSIGAHAGNDNDDYQYRDGSSGVVRRCRTVVVTDTHSNYRSDRYQAENDRADYNRRDPDSVSYPATYQREQCWNEQTNVYDDGYYRDGSGRLYRGDSHSNTSGILIGALVGGAIGNQVGKGDGRTAATIAGAVIGGSIGAHADNNDDNQYRGDSGVVRRCRTVAVVDDNR